MRDLREASIYVKLGKGSVHFFWEQWFPYGRIVPRAHIAPVERGRRLELRESVQHSRGSSMPPIAGGTPCHTVVPRPVEVVPARVQKILYRRFLGVGTSQTSDRPLLQKYMGRLHPFKMVFSFMEDSP
ncbi:uncharacterized protein M6B38_401875 [Iris pallida]|uniref:Uncharacterized protein n=1 Tax=Iris pallida TaxID=29817 RepID=A0AAX6FTZ5_IRIPA|nr:uncharacterized protein M6B38_401875 [Iris pallida]